MNDDENTPPRVAIDVTSERVTYNQDVVDYLVHSEILRCEAEGIPLTPIEIKHFKTELVKTLIIKHQTEKAVNMRIKEKK